MNNICLLLVTLSGLIFTFHIPNTYGAATSPSFPRQEIPDSKYTDWIRIDENGKPDYLSSNASQEIPLPFPDITSVSYSSDGAILNSTIWLSSEFEKEPGGHSPFYIMYLDVDANNQTGLTGGDYAIGINWNATSNKWTKVLLEFSSVSTDKVLRKEEMNYTDFSDENMNSVHFYVYLKEIYNPTKYNIAFTIQDVLNKEDVYDSTSWLPIPPPQVNITTSQNSLVLRPGDEKRIQLHLESDTELQPRIIFDPPTSSDVELQFNPKNTKLSFDGKATSTMHIKVLPDAENQTLTIPLLTHIEFPLERDNEKGLDIHRFSYLILDILPPLNFVDYINSGVNMLGSPVKQVLETLTIIFSLAGVGGVTTWKLIKRRKKKSRKVNRDEVKLQKK
jgi:hypothetical protein